MSERQQESPQMTAAESHDPLPPDMRQSRTFDRPQGGHDSSDDTGPFFGRRRQKVCPSFYGMARQAALSGRSILIRLRTPARFIRWHTGWSVWWTSGSCMPVRIGAAGRLRSSGTGESACRPGSVHPLTRAGGHPSTTAVAGSLLRSTREHRAGRPQPLARTTHPKSTQPFLTLLRVGFTKPPQSPAALVVSCATAQWHHHIRRVDGRRAGPRQARLPCAPQES